MPRILKRPLGITVIAALLTFIGGAMTLFTLIEAFDAIRTSGLEGITFDKPVSFLGFLLYGAGPIFLYSLGMGLFMSQRWAFVFAEKVLPAFALFLFINLTINITRTQQPYLYRVNFFRLIGLRPGIFLWTIFWYALLMWPMRLYLRLPYIQGYFQSEKLDGFKRKS